MMPTWLQNLPVARAPSDGEGQLTRCARGDRISAWPRGGLPEAQAVVEPALHHVALDEVDMLLAGSTGAAECGALGSLC